MKVQLGRYQKNISKESKTSNVLGSLKRFPRKFVTAMHSAGSGDFFMILQFYSHREKFKEWCKMNLIHLHKQLTQRLIYLRNLSDCEHVIEKLVVKRHFGVLFSQKYF